MTILSTKKGMLLTVVLMLFAMQMYGQAKISGTVADEKGDPLPSVTVKSKLKKSAITATDINGRFQIIGANETDSLIFTFVGYRPKTVSIKGISVIHITMQPLTGGLNDVVVVGYGTQKKVDLTGAISTISGAVLEDKPIPNVGRGLMGQLPGLNISSYSGQPGVGTSFNIRGFTSINGGSPLILVDNVETDVNDINPDDIASVTILKDAASSAVYGSRAPFGVVLITTKSGHVGTPKITYSLNYAYHKITDLPAVVTDPGTVVDYKNEAYSAYYGVNDYNSFETAYAHQRSANPSLSPTIVDPDNPTQYDYLGNTNWFSEAYKNGSTSQIHNLSVSGGSDKINYYFSAGYNTQDGIFKYNTDYYDRYNLRAKLDIELTKWLHVYTNSAYNRSTYNAPSLWTSDWTSGDFYHTLGRSNSLDPVYNPDGSYTSAGVIIGFLQQGGRADTVMNRTQNTIGFNTSFLNNSLRVNGDFTFRSTDTYMQGYQVPIPYETGPGQQVSYAGHSTAYANSLDENYYNLNLYTEYEKTFNTKNYFKAMLGYNQEYDSYNEFSASNNGLISNDIGYLGETTGTTPSVGGDGAQWALRGAFARINYEYDKKYLLEVSAREDGSSRFPSDQHYGFFPSASVGWRISEEPFFKDLTAVVNNLKFRASYGSLGNDQSLGDYTFVPTLTSGRNTSAILGGIQPAYVGAPNLVSPSLTWETIYSKDLGIDVTLFSKLNVTFDVYQRDTKNMITQGFQFPGVLGATQPLENAADLRTTGWELNLTYNNETTIAGKPFRYGLHANLWDNQTVITKYYNPTDYILTSLTGNSGYSPGTAYYTGSHVGDIWGLTDVGIFQSNKAAAAAPNQSQFMGYYPLNVAGELQYKDLNHDGKITYGNGTASNPGDLSVIGNTTPRYNFGFGGNFTYSDFDFSIFFQGVGKESFWPGDSGYYWSMFFAPWENVSPSIVNNTWTPQNPNAFYPTLKGWRAGDDGSLYDLAVPQTRYMYSAAYIRLKNLTAGYTFPIPALKKIGIDRIRVYVSGEDLWESDKLPQGYDPEALNGTWGSGKVYPFQRSYSFGLDVKF